MNVLTFSVMIAGAFIVLFWFLNDVLPQILFQRKLDKTARLAEESRLSYEWARMYEETMELRMPDWDAINEQAFAQLVSSEIARSHGWIE